MEWIDWLPDGLRNRLKMHRTIRRLQKCAEATWAEYNPRLEAEKKLKGVNSEAYQSLLSEAIYMAAEFTEEIEQIETERLLTEANRYFLDTTDLGTPKGGGSHWEDGRWDHRFLSRDAFMALRKLVYKAKREHAKERRERCLFWFGIIAGLIGMGTTVFNTFTNQKWSALSNRVSAIEKVVSRTTNK